MKTVEKVLKLSVGTYDEFKEDSIYLVEVSLSGKAKVTSALNGGRKTSYLTFSTSETDLYAINEIEDFENRGGAVISFHLKGDQWEFGSQLHSGGVLPVAVCFVENEKSIVVANYLSGTIAVLPVAENGQLEKVSHVVQHTGSGPHSDRQTAPHAHQVIESPDKRFIFVIDLGTDEITGYTLSSGKLEPAPAAVAFTAAPGSGPRHLVFHPDGKHAFLVQELNSTVSFLSYSSTEGTFTALKTLSAIPPDFKEENKCGGIQILPNGRNLYVSNRGHDSIVSFSVDSKAKIFEMLECTSVEGHWPRDFCIDKTGNLLVAACQKSNSLTMFHIDQTTGRLNFTGHELNVDQPVFCEFYGEND